MLTKLLRFRTATQGGKLTLIGVQEIRIRMKNKTIISLILNKGSENQQRVRATNKNQNKRVTEAGMIRQNLQ